MADSETSVAAAASVTSVDELGRRRLIAIAREPVYRRPVALARGLLSAGVTVIEFTFTGCNADDAIADVKAECPKLLVGAGTVTNGELLKRTIAAGADFAVSPVLDPNLVRAASGSIAFIPGVFTPTEAARAGALGCTVVKVYPARTGGVDYIRDLRAVLPQVQLIPTGGIGIDDARDYLEAGALAVGLGTALLPPGADLATVHERARRAVAAVAQGAAGATKLTE
jgi:2-dehydro-3-deoxyphosphogluconate aldolase/(4S)-4-hydroxy-2-oxoglutarate aldolase